MAGLYPDVPGNRMALDRDGTVGFVSTSGVVSQLTQANMSTLNDEAQSLIHDEFANFPPTRYWGYIFPELRDVVGSFLAAFSTATNGGLQTSVNTTSGLDGTWVNASGHPGNQETINPNYRTAIAAVNWPGIKAVRFQLGGGENVSRNRYYKWHLYGKPSAGQAPSRLRLWHPTLSQEVTGAYFDWGDVGRSTTADRTFRVYNPSSLTANNVALSTEALTNSSPAITSQHTFSFAGSTFATTLNIGSIPPGTVSGVVTVRRTINSGAALGIWALRIIAAAGSYT